MGKSISQVAVWAARLPDRLSLGKLLSSPGSGCPERGQGGLQGAEARGQFRIRQSSNSCAPAARTAAFLPTPPPPLSLLLRPRPVWAGEATEHQQGRAGPVPIQASTGSQAEPERSQTAGRTPEGCVLSTLPSRAHTLVQEPLPWQA